MQNRTNPESICADPGITENYSRAYDKTKRFLDILTALLLLAVLWPVFLLTAALIKLTMPGRAIYSQKRVGRGGRPFTLYKFRTLRENEDFDNTIGHLRNGKLRSKLVFDQKDKRLTRLGRFLRKSSIDELPQFWNVLKGDMSMVGPRPLVPHMLFEYSDFNQVRSAVRPGITGLWQVRDRKNKNSVAAMMPHDKEYVENYSFGLDLKIMVMTLPTVFKWHETC